MWHIAFLVLAAWFSTFGTVSAGTYSCSADTNICNWQQEVWDGLWRLRTALCSDPYPQLVQEYEDQTSTIAVQMQKAIKAGSSDSHCWDVTYNLIWSCFDTERGHYSGSGTWSSDANVDEWYWVWANPNLRDGCVSANRCIARKADGSC